MLVVAGRLIGVNVLVGMTDPGGVTVLASEAADVTVMVGGGGTVVGRAVDIGGMGVPVAAGGDTEVAVPPGFVVEGDVGEGVRVSVTDAGTGVVLGGGFLAIVMATRSGTTYAAVLALFLRPNTRTVITWRPLVRWV